MKTERQHDQDVAERLRRENLERVDAGGCAPPVLVSAAPKDNEVDEKVIPEGAVAVVSGVWSIMWAGDRSVAHIATKHNLAIGDYLYSPATVAELRADRDSWREQAEDRLREWDKLRAEVERLHFELDMLRGNYEQQTAYTIIHKGVLRYCNSSMRDAYSDETARADAAERRVAELEAALVACNALSAQRLRNLLELQP